MNLDATNVSELLDLPALIAAMEKAFRDGFDIPARHHHKIAVPGGADATLLLMPAWIPGRFIGVKVAQVFPSNSAHQLPSVQSLYLLMSGSTGQLLATIDGGELTTRRTVATSSLAARYLARRESSRLLIVGTGQVARQIAASHAAVLPVHHVDVWGRDEARAHALAEHLSRSGFLAQPVTDLPEATARADIVSCCTLSHEPLIDGTWLRPGTHLDLIGSFTPSMREVDDAAIVRSVIIVDTVNALLEAGDIVQPLQSGLIQHYQIEGTLADLVNSRHPGRRTTDEITLFKSVGAAIEDLAAAILCYDRATTRQKADNRSES